MRKSIPSLCSFVLLSFIIRRKASAPPPSSNDRLPPYCAGACCAGACPAGAACCCGWLAPNPGKLLEFTAFCSVAAFIMADSSVATLGMKNTVELLTEKNNLLSAQQQRIQAKYMAILDRTLLNFYAGQDIKL